MEEFCSQAGEAADELRRRVALYESLHHVGDAVKAETKRDRTRPAPVEPETTLGRYRIEKLIDEGGMSRVYLAHDPELDRKVALKVIENVGIVSNQTREWMRNEARSLARLDHPGIVRVLDVESDGVHDFIVMEHVPGPSLTRVIAEMRRRRDGGTTDPDGVPPTVELQRTADRLETYTARARLVQGIAEALAWAHDRGVLHRDIKPGNVLLDEDGSPRLIDFGLAHIEEQASAVGATSKLYGTAEYVAPEQVDQQRAGADPLTDQYSLGVLLFELLTLQSPFHRRTRALTLDAVSKAAPKRPRQFDASVPRDLETICLHAIEREPEERYPGVAGMAADLEAWLEHRPLSVSATASRVVRLWARRNRQKLVLAGSVVFLLFFTGTGVWTLAELGERTDIRTLLSGIRIERLEQPEEFMDAFGQLRHAAARANVFDAGWLRSSVLGEQEDQVDAVAESLSRRLADVLADLKVGREPSQVNAEMVRWMPVVRMEEELCAKFEFNREDRMRGQVLLADHSPSEVQVFRYEPATEGGVKNLVQELVLRPYSKTPSRGTYVVLGPRPELDAPPLQTCFWLDTEAQPVQTLALRKPDPELLARTVRVVGGTYVAGPEGPPLPPLHVPDFAIMERPVTWRQARAFLLEHWGREQWARQCGDLAADDPALLTWAEAFALAQWSGMRLPTSLEVTLARRHGSFRLAFEAPYPEMRYLGEWVAEPDFEGGRERHALDYSNLANFSLPREWLRLHLPDAEPRGPGPLFSQLPPGRKRATLVYVVRLAVSL